MDLRELRYFLEVVNRQSYTAAAEALFVTQPNVSKMIKQMEVSLGAPLLVKEGRRLSLTDAGRVVYQRGQELLAMHAQMLAEVADLDQLTHGELVMGIPPLSNGLLAPLIATFHRKYPGIELKLFEKGSRTVEDELRAGTLEVGAMLLPVDDEFDTLPICRYPLQLIAPADSPWAGRTSVRLADLAQEPFIFYGEGFVLNEVVHAACVRAGFTPRIAGRSSQWDFVASMVEAGVGIALLPELFGMQLNRSRFVVLPIDAPQIWWNMVLAWRKNKYLSFAARAWLELARDALEGPGLDITSAATRYPGGRQSIG
ncbi:LysR family transcriptional regulator [Pigmentiphaga litoralis]|jgi:DNA-binding transcriptional LysR family regulator|uniref:LysR family transcriptional regulator n=1 Tax=Pigmentiphaga litoralis TaxID=516702 RepID=UPI00167A4FC8|nr:LysR family transcriptional regulator [Pigmentiphaga litoralis]GGX01756.1 LysR family transcriptional regulator [Pigmentiphaga litoralis]